MKKSEKLRREAEALKQYADTLAANGEHFECIVARTDQAVSELLSGTGGDLAVEYYRAKIHRINMDSSKLNRSEDYARAMLKSELKAIEAEYYETNE